MKLIYKNLDIEVTLGSGKDTTTDHVQFRNPVKSEQFLSIENSLKYQPTGIKTLAATLGIKKSGKIDFTVVTLPQAGPAASVLTRCMCPSYTILRNREILKEGQLQAIAVNSGNANVFTPNGDKDLNHIAQLLSQEFQIKQNHFFISSTGVIGVPLPIEKFQKGIPGLKSQLKENNLDAAASAILTTDLGPKTASFKHNDLIICGMAKGAGMIEPNLATMLVYFFTNAKLSSPALQNILSQAVDSSFNCISIDSDTSTSDSVTLLSTAELELSENELKIFQSALRAMSIKLARDIVSQGEGVSKIIEVSVNSNISEEFSRVTAKKIINSPLVKAAVHGADPNWGRVVMAIGKPEAGKNIKVLGEENIEIKLQGEVVFSKKENLKLDLAAISKKIRESKIASIEVTIGNADYPTRAWGCDLTEEYVTFNSDYTT